MIENGIREQSYYCWQRRFRQQTYAELKRNVSVSDVTETADLAFIEIPCTSLPEQNTYTSANTPAAIIRTGTNIIRVIKGNCGIIFFDKLIDKHQYHHSNL